MFTVQLIYTHNKVLTIEVIGVVSKLRLDLVNYKNALYFIAFKEQLFKVFVISARVSSKV